MNNNVSINGIIIGLLFLLVSNSFSPITIANKTIDISENESPFIAQFNEIEQAPVTCFASGPDYSLIQQEKILSSVKIKILFTKLSELNDLLSTKSSKENISRLQNEIIELAINYSLLPQEYKLPQQPISPKNLLQPQKSVSKKQFGALDFWKFQFVCNFISFGSGSTGPFLVFPRLVPILLFPIPRLFMTWSAEEGFTSCGGLLRMLGYVALGKQKGFALGFWGVGFSVFLPPVSAYGVFGYTLFVGATAEDFIGYPFPLLFYILLLLLYGY
jgi:hypothetical protein